MKFSEAISTKVRVLFNQPLRRQKGEPFQSFSGLDSWHREAPDKSFLVRSLWRHFPGGNDPRPP